MCRLLSCDGRCASVPMADRWSERRRTINYSNWHPQSPSGVARILHWRGHPTTKQTLCVYYIIRPGGRPYSSWAILFAEIKKGFSQRKMTGASESCYWRNCRKQPQRVAREDVSHQNRGNHFTHQNIQTKQIYNHNHRSVHKTVFGYDVYRPTCLSYRKRHAVQYGCLRFRTNERCRAIFSMRIPWWVTMKTARNSRNTEQQSLFGSATNRNSIYLCYSGTCAFPVLTNSSSCCRNVLRPTAPMTCKLRSRSLTSLGYSDDVRWQHLWATQILVMN